MTTTGELSLKGLSQYLEDLAQAGDDVDAAADVALAAGAEILQDGMISEIEAQKLIDTHNLENHIRVKGPMTDGNRHEAWVGLVSDIKYTDADTARYGNAQEYGYTQGGKHYPARSYIRAGHDKKKKAAQDAIKESLKRDGKL